MRTRDRFIDAIKGFSIVLVVVGHCIQYGSGSEYFAQEGYFSNFLFRFIYSFHMPLFMLISGYLFSFSVEKYAARELAASRFKSLVLPIFSWTLLIEGVKAIVRMAQGHRLAYVSTVVKAVGRCFTSLWFLWAVFFCSIVVLVVRKLGRNRLWIHLLLLLVSLLIPDSHNLGLYKFMYPYFLLGYYFNQYGGSKRYEKMAPGIIAVTGVLASILFFSLLAHFDREDYIYTSGIFLNGANAGRQLLIDVSRWAIGFIGSLLVLSLLHAVNNRWKAIKAWDALAYFGRSSTGIYIISGFLNLYMLSRMTIKMQFSATAILIETFIMLFLSVFLSKAIERNYLLSLLFLGNRSTTTKNSTHSAVTGHERTVSAD